MKKPSQASSSFFCQRLLNNFFPYQSRTLFRLGHLNLCLISLFFLGFPGVVTSIGLLVLYRRGSNARLSQMPMKRVLIYAGCLLTFYPVLPTVL